MVKRDLNISLATKMLKKLDLYASCIFLPKISAYRKDFDGTKYISFLIRDDESLEKYNGILEKVKYSFQKEFNMNKYI